MIRTPPPERPSDESPHVPGFRSWRALYCVVLVCLALFIVSLALWSRWFK